MLNQQTASLLQSFPFLSVLKLENPHRQNPLKLSLQLSALDFRPLFIFIAVLHIKELQKISLPQAEHIVLCHMLCVNPHLFLRVKNNSRIPLYGKNVLAQQLSDVIDGIPQVFPGSLLAAPGPQHPYGLASGYIFIHA